MKQRSILFLLTLVAILTVSATSDNRQEAVALYQKAKKYEKGEGVEKDLEKAAQLYLKAAEMGLDSAQNMIGNCYDDAVGIFQDKEKAVFWYHKAAEQGYAPAQANLAICYSLGKGVPVDEKIALEWIQKAAAQGSISGMMQLAEAYYSGGVVPKDYQKAKELVEQVIKKNSNHKRAQYYLQRINKNIKEQQLAAAPDRAERKWPRPRTRGRLTHMRRP